MTKVTAIEPPREAKAWVYCPICTHTVEGAVLWGGRRPRVKPGEKCSRCHSPLEAGVVMRVQQVA